MGKPSSYHHSRTSIDSIHSSSSHQRIQAPLSAKKAEAKMRRNQCKTKKNIQKLFQNLRRIHGANSSQDDTLETIEDEINEGPENNDGKETDQTAIELFVSGQKRKQSSSSNKDKKRNKLDGSVILLSDDDSSLNEEPNQISTPNSTIKHINCSTPLSQSDDQTLQNMIVANFSSNYGVLGKDIVNLTKEINGCSYITIDLTGETDVSKTNATVVELDKSDDTSLQSEANTVVSAANLSMSDDSNATVLENRKISHLNKLTKGISRMNPKDKDKLLEVITQNIFSGCNFASDIKASLPKITTSQSIGTDTMQDTFIKEVILGEAPSRNSVGSNIYHPSHDDNYKTGLRMIVIDGNNVAMEHTKGKIFSVRALKICIDYFLMRGHVVKAFVPRFRYEDHP